jgi:formylglycine-generating enzyme required for sulfatase activity
VVEVKRQPEGTKTRQNWRPLLMVAFGMVALVAIVVVALVATLGGRRDSSTGRPPTPDKKPEGKKGEDKDPGSKEEPYLNKTLPYPAGAAREITNSIGMKLVLIPAGTFTLGSPSSEPGRSYDEGPQHRVEVRQPFYLGAFEVTQEQYARVMGNVPSEPGKKSKNGKDEGTRNFPVEYVTWHEAANFCARLSDLPEETKAGRRYYLPTEAQWEYACRGGAPAYRAFHVGDSLSPLQANYDEQVGRARAVGSYPANCFGLYDMHGNVAEWCSDWYDANYYAQSPRVGPQGPSGGIYLGRVRRGGSYSAGASSCRSASRSSGRPSERISGQGFRVAAAVSGGQGK